MIPTTDLGNGISINAIILKLNTGNIFDFDYTPQERDSLHICFNAENREEYKYFSLIYLDMLWQVGRNPAFRSIEKDIAKGKLKCNENNSSQNVRNIRNKSCFSR